MKLHAHPVMTGQARRGRSTELTALSMPNGLPGHASGEQNVSKGSFLHIVPLDPAYEAGLAGHVPAKGVGCLKGVSFPALQQALPVASNPDFYYAPEGGGCEE